jgi:hypothetical protein
MASLALLMLFHQALQKRRLARKTRLGVHRRPGVLPSRPLGSSLPRAWGLPGKSLVRPARPISLSPVGRSSVLTILFGVDGRLRHAKTQYTVRRVRLQASTF